MTKERLNILKESNDGFYISEKDFEMRGEGDIFGERQSGDMHFKMANIKRDSKIWLQAFKDSKEYLDNFDNNSLYLGIINDLTSNSSKYNSNINMNNDFTINYMKNLNLTWPKIDENYLTKFLKKYTK